VGAPESELDAERELRCDAVSRGASGRALSV
jgi:hypothetical protein